MIAARLSFSPSSLLLRRRLLLPKQVGKGVQNLLRSRNHPGRAIAPVVQRLLECLSDTISGEPAVGRHFCCIANPTGRFIGLTVTATSGSAAGLPLADMTPGYRVTCTRSP